MDDLPPGHKSGLADSFMRTISGSVRVPWTSIEPLAADERHYTKYRCKDVWPTDIRILCVYDGYYPCNGAPNGDLSVHVVAFPVRRFAYFFLAGAAGFLAADVSALPVLGFLSCSFSLVNSCTLAWAWARSAFIWFMLVV